MDETREQLAEYAHAAWAGWMLHMMPIIMPLIDLSRINEYPGSVEAIGRWARQAKTEYARLPSFEQASDRDEADKILAIFRREQRSESSAEPCETAWVNANT